MIDLIFLTLFVYWCSYSVCNEHPGQNVRHWRFVPVINSILVMWLFCRDLYLITRE